MVGVGSTVSVGVQLGGKVITKAIVGVLLGGSTGEVWVGGGNGLSDEEGLVKINAKPQEMQTTPNNAAMVRIYHIKTVRSGWLCVWLSSDDLIRYSHFTLVTCFIGYTQVVIFFQKRSVQRLRV